MLRLLTISLFITACQKRESLFSEGVLNQLWETAPFCAMNVWVWQVWFYFFFLHNAGAQQHSARHLARYASFVMKAGFRDPCWSCCPLEFEHRHVLPLRRQTTGAGQLLICSSPQLDGAFRPTLAVLGITILLSILCWVGSLMRQHRFLVSVSGISA